MEHKVVHIAELYPLIQETLERGGTFSMTVTGSSMYPFLGGNRDQVTLRPITGPLKKNDLPLYRRDSGAFVLHRIIKVEKDGTYTCCGDHQALPEKGLRRDQMVGVATEFVRKGRHFTDKNLIYRVYRTVWTWALRYRWILFRLREKTKTKQPVG